MTRHAIEAAEKPLQKILSDDYLFSIPSYQRSYAWTTEQTGEMLADLTSACGDVGSVHGAVSYQKQVGATRFERATSTSRT